MLALLIWAFCGCIFFALGIYAFVSKKPVGFYANIKEPPKVTDIRAYNRAVGTLKIVVYQAIARSGYLPRTALKNSTQSTLKTR